MQGGRLLCNAYQTGLEEYYNETTTEIITGFLGETLMWSNHTLVFEISVLKLKLCQTMHAIANVINLSQTKI